MVAVHLLLQRVLHPVGRRRGDGGGEQGREDGRADGSADLLRACERRTRDARVPRLDAGERDVLHGHEHEREPDAEEDLAGQHLHDVRAVDRDPAEPQQPRGREERADRHEDARADLRQEPRDLRGREHDGRGHRQRREARDQRRHAEHDLEVQREVEQPAEERRAHHHRGEVRAAAGAVGHHAGRQQRVARPRLPPHEGDHDPHAEREEADGVGLRPAVLRAGEAVDDGCEAEGDEEGAGHVVAAVAVGAALLHERDAGDDRDDRDGHVDEQAPVPAEVLGEHAAEQQADGRTGSGDGAVDRERLDAVGAGRERHRQERERGGREERGEDALEAARDEERLARDGEPADRAGRREADHAEEEGALAAPVVGDAAAEQEERAEGERVDGDDPRAVGVGHAEVALGGGQGDVHDGAVEHDHQLGEGDDGEEDPLAAGGRRGRSGGAGGCGGAGERCGGRGRRCVLRGACVRDLVLLDGRAARAGEDGPI